MRTFVPGKDGVSDTEEEGKEGRDKKDIPPLLLLISSSFSYILNISNFCEPYQV